MERDATLIPAPAVPARALCATVDLGRLAGNLAALRRAAQGKGVLAVVKADAYGHGAVQVARALESGVEGFCVATLEEGLELRAAGIAAPILLFGGLPAAALPVAAAHRLELAVVSAEHLRTLAELLPQHPAGLHLKLDTGMGRAGLLLEELGTSLDLFRRVRPWLRGVMAHFATADEDDVSHVHRQRRRFAEALAELRAAGIDPPMVHHANSAGCLRGFTEGDSHVRCGIGLYGLAEVPEAKAAGLRPVLELGAEVQRAVVVPAGTAVGYGCTWTAPHSVKLATLACGYADGFPRALANRARAGFGGATHPVVGMVSMDSITVALPADSAIRAGDRMVLLSREPDDPHSVQSTARLLGTIPYEVTCALHRRVARSSV